MFTRKNFDTNGFAVIPSLLCKSEVAKLRHLITAVSGVNDGDYQSRVFECPDGVSTHREFWWLIVHDLLLKRIRYLIGDNIRYTQHSDIHAHRTGSWHRDCACRKFSVGPDWEGGEPYQVIRVAIYLQSFRESHSSLGIIPGSHRFEQRLTEQDLRYWDRYLRARAKISVLRSKVGLSNKWNSPDHRMTMWTTPNPNRWLTCPQMPIWLKTEPGDCVIFDQRLYHSASPIKGPKYAVYLSYSPENRHAVNHLGYYRHFRRDLGYKSLAPELVEILKERQLYMAAPPPECVDGYFRNGVDIQ